MGGDPIPGPLDFLRKADSLEMEEVEAAIFILESRLRDAKMQRDFLMGMKRQGQNRAKEPSEKRRD